MNTTKLTEKEKTKALVNIKTLEAKAKKLAGDPHNSVSISEMENFLIKYGIESQRITKLSTTLQENLCYLFFTLNGISYYALGQVYHEEYVVFINKPPFECEIFSVFSNDLLDIINEHNEELLQELNKVSLSIKNDNFYPKS
ncbi:hypothetical protein [Priestia megaterium]|uniref:Uncharacterized protein n=1 Tax=Priestia megaterium TaxID=1404 RepID=A0A6M6E5Y1_PRIMG|nr:hypothetical protein [Priestia megaterium]QJX79917.1 hypothetical protein FDZ14_27845 [Priestia megaterium]